MCVALLTGTIALATTLKKSTETQSSPTVDIKGLQWALSSGASAKVQRNSVVLWELMESGTLDFNGFSDNDENTNDIEVVIAGGAGGSVVVKCAKISGYGSQQHQGADGSFRIKMKLITEVTEDIQYISEEKNGKRNLYIEGVFLQSNLTNRNNRTYPKEIMRKEVDRYRTEQIDKKRAMGELGHPDALL